MELNDEVRIFPRHHVQIPHVAGWQSQETNYAVTYYGLSNLAMVVETDYGLGEANLQVLGQAHNNLIFKDVNNGTAIQQMTMQSEFTDHSATVHPNTMMEWSIAKEMYPEAQVYIYAMDRFVDDLLLDVFEGPLEMQRTKGERFIFPTLDLADNRIDVKTEIFGYNNGKAQIAIDPSFALSNDGYQFELAGEPLQIQTDGKVVRLINTDSGKQVSPVYVIVLQTSYLEGIMETTKLSSKGQVIIPKPFRRSLRWDPGQELVVVSVGDGLLLRPKSPFPETAIDDVAGCLQYEGEVKTLDEMERAIAQGVREHQCGVD